MNAPSSIELDGQQWLLIDRICCRFEEACQSGATPLLEPFLNEAPPAIRTMLFRELLTVDLEQRRHRGEKLNREAYKRKWAEFEQIVFEVFELERVGDRVSMKCPKCRFDNPAGQDKCGKCREPLNAGSGPAKAGIVCGKCSKEMPANAVYCGFCRNPLKPTPQPDEKKVATPPPPVEKKVASSPIPVARPAATRPSPVPATPAKSPVVMGSATTVDLSPGVSIREERREARADQIAPADSLRPMVLIPTGEFLMGSPDGIGRDDERPQHKVKLSAFYIDRYAVSNIEYERFDPTHRRQRPEVADGDEDPVVMVTHQECLDYCRWRAEQEGAPADAYSLPTEAQWERAARGGFPDRLYSWGDAILPDLCNTSEIGRQRTVSVMENGVPNGFFIMHMGSNVREWCLDCYSRIYYAQKATAWMDPKGPPVNPMENFRVVRGASFIEKAEELGRCAARGFASPRNKQSDLGFRCIRLVTLR